MFYIEKVSSHSNSLNVMSILCLTLCLHDLGLMMLFFLLFVSPSLEDLTKKKVKKHKLAFLPLSHSVSYDNHP